MKTTRPNWIFALFSYILPFFRNKKRKRIYYQQMALQFSQFYSFCFELVRYQFLINS